MWAIETAAHVPSFATIGSQRLGVAKCAWRIAGIVRSPSFRVPSLVLSGKVRVS